MSSIEVDRLLGKEFQTSSESKVSSVCASLSSKDPNLDHRIAHYCLKRSKEGRLDRYSLYMPTQHRKKEGKYRSSSCLISLELPTGYRVSITGLFSILSAGTFQVIRQESTYL